MSSNIYSDIYAEVSEGKLSKLTRAAALGAGMAAAAGGLGVANKVMSDNAPSQAYEAPAETEDSQTEPAEVKKENKPIKHRMRKFSAFVQGELDYVAPHIKANHPEALVYAVLYKESSLGTNIKPRYEEGFRKVYGKTYRKWGFEKEYIKRYGNQYKNKEAALIDFYSSHGPYQMMLPVAWEMGYKVSGKDFDNPDIYRKIFIAKANKDLLRSDSVAEFGRRYNGGTSYGKSLSKLYTKVLATSSNLAEAEETIPKYSKKHYANTVNERDDSNEFRKWFGDSKVVDADGQPAVCYHGTLAEFSEFSRKKASTNSYAGSGFYFSNKPSDIEKNYFGGGDFTSKLDNAVEEFTNLFTQVEEENELDDDGQFIDIEQAQSDCENMWVEDYLVSDEVNDQFDIDMEFVSNLFKAYSSAGASKRMLQDTLRNRIAKHAGAIMPCYLKIENPLYLGLYQHRTEVPIFELPDYEEMYKEAQEELGVAADKDELEDRARELQQEGADYHENYYNLESAYTATEEIASDSFDRLWDYLVEDVDYEDGTVDFDMVVKHFSSSIIEPFVSASEYDGVIMNAAKAFRHMELDPDTIHFITYNPTNIKSVFNKGTFDSSSSNILEADNFGYNPKNPMATEEFKEWFGNSVGIKSNKTPAVFYHGTGADHHEFSMAINFVSTSADFAETFAWGKNKNIMPVYVSVQNPCDTKELLALLPTLSVEDLFDGYYRYHIKDLLWSLPTVIDPTWFEDTYGEDASWEQMGDEAGLAYAKAYGESFKRDLIQSLTDDVLNSEYGWAVMEAPAILQAIKDAGYDAIKTREGGAVNYGIFDGKKIKSVFNKGTFDANNPNIMEARVDPLKNPNFLEWFDDGDMVDMDGNPQVFYHGTYASGDINFSNEINFITNSAEVAEYYSDSLGHGGDRILPVYTNLKMSEVCDIEQALTLANNSSRKVQEDLLEDFFEEYLYSGETLSSARVFQKVNQLLSSEYQTDSVENFIKQEWFRKFLLVKEVITRDKLATLTPTILYSLDIDYEDLVFYCLDKSLISFENCLPAMRKFYDDEEAYRFLEHWAILNIIKDAGYAAIETLEHGATNYGIFSNARIKSVLNKGTFDASNPNIRENK